MRLFRCDFRCETTGEGGTIWVLGTTPAQVEAHLWATFHKEGLSEIRVSLEERCHEYKRECPNPSAGIVC